MVWIDWIFWNWRLSEFSVHCLFFKKSIIYFWQKNIRASLIFAIHYFKTHMGTIISIHNHKIAYFFFGRPGAIRHLRDVYALTAPGRNRNSILSSIKKKSTIWHNFVELLFGPTPIHPSFEEMRKRVRFNWLSVICFCFCFDISYICKMNVKLIAKSGQHQLRTGLIF